MGATARPVTRTYRIVHTTRYDFDSTVRAASLDLRLRPRDLPNQRCDFHQTVTRPLATTRREIRDGFGNACLCLEFATPLQALQVSTISRVVVTDCPHVASEASPPWEQCVRERVGRDDCGWEGQQGSIVTPDLRQRLLDYAASAFHPGRPVLSAAEDLMRKIAEAFSYDAQATHIATPVAELLVSKRGVCQDYARVLTALLRAVGLAARYVSGYVDNTPEDGRRVIGASAPHAWCALGVPGLGVGWVGLDPTNNRRVGLQYVTVAWGSDYDDVAPVTGSFAGAAGQRLAVSVDVAPADDEAGRQFA